MPSTPLSRLPTTTTAPLRTHLLLPNIPTHTRHRHTRRRTRLPTARSPRFTRRHRRRDARDVIRDGALGRIALDGGTRPLALAETALEDAAVHLRNLDARDGRQRGVVPKRDLGRVEGARDVRPAPLPTSRRSPSLGRGG